MGLKGDQERFQQIMINLLRNALKFTNNGVIKVKIFYEKSESRISVWVVDTGKGIKKRDQEGIFDMFGKKERTAKQNSEGLGLGLTICKLLVEQYNGEI